MARTVTDVALLDAAIVGRPPVAAADLRKIRLVFHTIPSGAASIPMLRHCVWKQWRIWGSAERPL